jgi:uncharacterized protein with GYD domain
VVHGLTMLLPALPVPGDGLPNKITPRMSRASYVRSGALTSVSTSRGKLAIGVRDAPRDVRWRRPQPITAVWPLRGTREILVGVARDRRPGGSSPAEGEFIVPSYLIQVAYTPDAWAAMVKQPQNRLEAVRPVVEKLGGKFEHAWVAFGEYDIVGVVELPENTDAAAFSMAVAAGGACKAFKTTPLLSVEEGVEAMRKAQEAGYRRPG